MAKFTMISDLNKTKSFNYEITEEHYYITLKELFEQDKEEAYEIKMFYTNKRSQFGENEVVVTDKFMINLPKHLNEVVEKIKTEDSYRQLIEEGKLLFTIYEYEYKKGKKAYSVNWGQRSE